MINLLITFCVVTGSACRGIFFVTVYDKNGSILLFDEMLMKLHTFFSHESSCDYLRKFHWSLPNRADTPSSTVLKQLAVNRLIRKLMPFDIALQGLMKDSNSLRNLFSG